MEASACLWHAADSPLVCLLLLDGEWLMVIGWGSLAPFSPVVCEYTWALHLDSFMYEWMSWLASTCFMYD